MRKYFKVKKTFSRQTLSRNVRNLSVTWFKTVLSSSRDIQYESGAQVSESIYRAHALHANSLVSRCTMDFWSCSYNAIFENYDRAATSLFVPPNSISRPNSFNDNSPRRISINAFKRNRYRC